VGSATLTDEEVERVEKARAANGEAGERSMLDTIEAERAERLAKQAQADEEFDAAAPSGREAIDAAHQELADESGEQPDVPGVDAGAGLDPAIGEEPAPGGAQLTFGVGGKRPTSVSLRIAGGKVGVTDEIRKGRLVRVVQEMRVGELHFVDKVDSKTGQVTACERRQILKPTAPPRVEILD
jgi:hypothetical protein